MADEFIASEADTLESQRLNRLFRDNVFGKISDEQTPGEAYAKGQIVVSYIPDVSNDEIQRIATEYGLTLLEDIPNEFDRTVIYSYDVVQWPNIYDLIRAVWGDNAGPWKTLPESASNTGSVRYAQPNFIYRTADSPTARENLSVANMSGGMILGIALIAVIFIYAKR